MFYFKIAVVLFVIGFLSFRKLTALLCLVSSLLFHSGVAESSFLGDTGVVYISRFALCLVRIALKLRRFRKSAPHNSQAYTDISLEHLASPHKPVFIGLNYRCGLHLQLKELLYSQKYSHWVIVLHYCWLSLAASMGTRIEQYRSRNDCHNNFVKAKVASLKAIMEYDAYDLMCFTCQH